MLNWWFCYTQLSGLSSSFIHNFWNEEKFKTTNDNQYLFFPMASYKSPDKPCDRQGPPGPLPEHQARLVLMWTCHSFVETCLKHKNNPVFESRPICECAGSSPKHKPSRRLWHLPSPVIQKSYFHLHPGNVTICDIPLCNLFQHSLLIFFGIYLIHQTCELSEIHPKYQIFPSAWKAEKQETPAKQAVEAVAVDREPKCLELEL